MHTNIRLDTTDYNKVEDYFKKYALQHPGTLFLLAKETGTQTGKPHLQGWCVHTSERTALRTSIDTSFPDLKGGSKSVTATKRIKGEYAYIVNNKTKTDYRFEDCITNYTQEQYDEITKDLPEHVSKAEFFSAKKSQTWWDSTIQILEDQCVYKGRILYSAISTVFFKQPMPKRISKSIIKENLQGMIMELERRHCSNTRLHDEYMESVVQDTLFKHSKEEFDLFKKIRS